jgi:ubiquinone/menaquinone biosynthesis C-methylase UbiE
MEAPIGHSQNADQIAFWNGPAGYCWAVRQERQDILFAPISEVLIDRAKARPGERIVDIGCGCGALTIALAEQVGSSGHALGIDISAPMLARAREMAPKDAPVQFVLADATVHQFQNAARADLLVSRFGVMFFADPVRSFVNIRTALRSEGRLTFACWREPRENPWLMTPLLAAYNHVPQLPKLGPEDPGPFSFASKDRVRRILSEAGFSKIEMEPCDFSLDMAIGRGLDAAVATALDSGPTSRALEDQPTDKVAEATNSIRKALAPFVKGQSVPLGAAIWIVTAVDP